MQLESILRSLIDALPEHIAMLDTEGVIVAANKAWRDFSAENDGPADGFIGTSYIDIAETSADRGDRYAKEAVRHIRQLLERKTSRFEMEYPCPSPTAERWFLMQGALVEINGDMAGIAVSHFNITTRKLLEYELADSRIKYKTIAEFAGDWEWWLSPEGNFRYMSPSCEDITGYTVAEFVQDPKLMDRILHPDDAPNYGHTSIDRIGESPSHYDEFRIRHKNGSTVWIGHLCRPVYGPDNRWIGRRATNRDITCQKELENKLKKYQSVIESSNDLVSLVDRNFVYRIVNSTYLDYFQVKKQDIEGKHVADLLGTDAFEKIIKPRMLKSLAGEVVQYDEWFEFAAGNRRYMHVSYYPQRAADGTIDGVAVSSSDITEIKLAEQALNRNEERLKEAQRIASFGNFEYDIKTGRSHWSDELYRLLGYTPNAVVPSFDHIREKIHPEDRELFSEYIQPSTAADNDQALEFRIIDKTGRTAWLSGNVFTDMDEQENPSRIHGTVMDVTRLKETEEKLARQATTDPLTGLNNRRRFLELCREELKRVRRNRTPLVLLMVDIDHFKRINDTYGHDAGDAVLKEFAGRVCAELRETDSIGRIGGEEFSVLLPETDMQSAKTVAERIRAAVSKKPVTGRTLHITVSIGGADFENTHRNTVESILKSADEALYKAKQSGRNQTVFGHDIHNQLEQKQRDGD